MNENQKFILMSIKKMLELNFDRFAIIDLIEFALNQGKEGGSDDVDR